MSTLANDLEAALAHMESCAEDGRVRYHGGRSPKEKHFRLQYRDGGEVRVPFLIAMQGLEAARDCIHEQVLAAGMLKDGQPS
jgi:hypothetical protein